jgi:uncharacterized protein YggE
MTMNEKSPDTKSPNATPDQTPPASIAIAAALGIDRMASRHAGPITLGRVIALTAAAGLLLGVIVGPILGGHSALAADPSASTSPDHIVTVSGVGQVSVAPDVADVVLGVTVQKTTVAAAQSSAATSMTAVLTAVKKDGVDAKDIVTIDLSLSPVYDYSGGSAPRLIGQQFSNSVRVTVRNLKSLAAVVDDAMAAGATTLGGISFRLSDPSTVQTKARQLAMADARTKADELTAAAGVSVRGVATITETTTQTTPVYYAGALDSKGAGVSTPIQTGTTDIVIQVTVSYLIG